jgi:hypothetical protein
MARRRTHKASRAKPAHHATHHAAVHHPRPPAVPAASRAPEPDTLGRGDPLPRSGPHADVGAAHARDLAAASAAAPPGLADVLLEIAGADHATLRAALTAWQREQDRVLNRAWRRPGGLARPAGL